MVARREEGWTSPLMSNFTSHWAEQPRAVRAGPFASLISRGSQQCAGPFLEQQRLCRLPEYVVRNPQGWATGNLSAWGDGAAGFTLPGFRFLPPPSLPRAGLAPLKPEEHSVKFEVGIRDRAGRDSGD